MLYLGFIKVMVVVRILVRGKGFEPAAKSAGALGHMKFVTLWPYQAIRSFW